MRRAQSDQQRLITVRPAPFAADDADVMLADMGVQLVCVAVPAVTVCLYDFERALDDGNDRRTKDAGRHIMRVKANAFGDTKVKSTRVTIIDSNANAFEFTIDDELPQPSSLFDHYILQEYRARSA